MYPKTIKIKIFWKFTCYVPCKNRKRFKKLVLGISFVYIQSTLFYHPIKKDITIQYSDSRKWYLSCSTLLLLWTWSLHKFSWQQLKVSVIFPVLFVALSTQEATHPAVYITIFGFAESTVSLTCHKIKIKYFEQYKEKNRGKNKSMLILKKKDFCVT